MASEIMRRCAKRLSEKMSNVMYANMAGDVTNRMSEHMSECISSSGSLEAKQIVSWQALAGNSRLATNVVLTKQLNPHHVKRKSMQLKTMSTF